MSRLLAVLGIGLASLGLLLNEWLLRLFSPDRTLEPSTRLTIRFFQAAALAIGLVLLKFQGPMAATLRRFARVFARSFATGLLISAVTTLAVLAGAEGLCAVLERERTAFTEERIPDRALTIDDPLLGYKPRPNESVRVVLKHRGQMLYDVRYTFDAAGRRVTPRQPSAGAKRALLFFGDSLTFGEGVNEDETLPYYVGQAVPSAAAYNYGFKGYGPHQMLAKLEEGDLPREVPIRRAMAIYTLIDDHVARAIGSMVPYTGWASNAPHYVLERGRPVRRGSFKTGRPGLQNGLYDLLGRSHILKYFRIDLPPALTDRHLQLVCGIVSACREAFERQFASEGFYAVCYPGEVHEAVSRRLIPMLRARGLTVLDYSTLSGWDAQRLRIPYDGHPTAEANRLLAAQLVKDLLL